MTQRRDSAASADSAARRPSGPEFREAVARLWNQIPRCARGLEQHGYMSLLHAVSTPAEEPDALQSVIPFVSPRRAATVLARDWETDAKGRGHLRMSSLAAILMEMLDRCIPGISSAELAEYVDLMTKRVENAPLRPPTRGTWWWAQTSSEELKWAPCPRAASALIESSFLHDDKEVVPMPGLRAGRTALPEMTEDTVVDFTSMVVFCAGKPRMRIKRKVYWQLEPDQGWFGRGLNRDARRRSSGTRSPRGSIQSLSSPGTRASSPRGSVAGIMEIVRRRSSLVRQDGRPAGVATAAALCCAVVAARDDADWEDDAFRLLQSEARDEWGWAPEMSDDLSFTDLCDPKQLTIVVGTTEYNIPVVHAVRHKHSVFALLAPGQEEESLPVPKFDRPPIYMPIVLEHLATGDPPAIENAPPEKLLEEWLFWRLPTEQLFPAKVLRNRVAVADVGRNEIRLLPMANLVQHPLSYWGGQAVSWLLGYGASVCGWSNVPDPPQEPEKCEPDDGRLLRLSPPKGGNLAAGSAAHFYETGESEAKIQRMGGADANAKQRLVMSQLRGLYRVPVSHELHDDVPEQKTAMADHVAAWISAAGLSEKAEEIFMTLPAEAQTALAWRVHGSERRDPGVAARKWKQLQKDALEESTATRPKGASAALRALHSNVTGEPPLRSPGLFGSNTAVASAGSLLSAVEAVSLLDSGEQRLASPTSETPREVRALHMQRGARTDLPDEVFAAPAPQPSLGAGLLVGSMRSAVASARLTPKEPETAAEAAQRALLLLSSSEDTDVAKLSEMAGIDVASPAGTAGWFSYPPGEVEGDPVELHRSAVQSRRPSAPSSASGHRRVSEGGVERRLGGGWFTPLRSGATSPRGLEPRPKRVDSMVAGGVAETVGAAAPLLVGCYYSPKSSGTTPSLPTPELTPPGFGKSFPEPTPQPLELLPREEPTRQPSLPSTPSTESEESVDLESIRQAAAGCAAVAAAIHTTLRACDALHAAAVDSSAQSALTAAAATTAAAASLSAIARWSEAGALEMSPRTVTGMLRPWRWTGLPDEKHALVLSGHRPAAVLSAVPFHLTFVAPFRSARSRLRRLSARPRPGLSPRREDELVVAAALRAADDYAPYSPPGKGGVRRAV